MGENNLAVISRNTHQLTAADMRAQVNLVQEVMKAVMKEGTHYGTIPGTKKPSLYKPGAEVLGVTFRIAASYRVEDLSAGEEIRYRIAAVGTHQTTGIVLGEGMGECSSGEEKYKWRRAICDEEFDLMPENRRRIKFSKYQGKVEKTKQVRAESADQANTILKMACKRAQVAMILNVTAASDIFTQDIEDLPEELRAEHEAEKKAPERPAITPYPDDKLQANLPKWRELVAAGGKTPDAIIKNVKSMYTLTAEQEKKIRELATAPAGTSDPKEHVQAPGAPNPESDPEWLDANK